MRLAYKIQYANGIIGVHVEVHRFQLSLLGIENHGILLWYRNISNRLA